MTKDEALILFLNHGCQLEAVPLAAWPLVAELFQPPERPDEFERSLEETIAAIVNEPLSN